ncbi:sensor histidine kinase [Streptomyces sp. CB02400]|uniref:sensor histidine kinase n=1 Tax=Streptomyces sp. CB02400 TaxID=1703944 RepID=UPI00093DFB87|nr:ATP-binding protein [Streptomyces sp. CB02400]OKK04173.1 ATP-binding protein [Streptomyces sp. CB02400]
MELATPPPAARAPVAWHGWWLMPLGLGGGTIAATSMGSDRITTAVLGAAATAACSMCVRLVLRYRVRLLRAEDTHRTSQAEHTRRWQQHMADQERRSTAERAEREQEFEERLAGQARDYEARLAEETETRREQLAHQLSAVARLADEQLPEAIGRLRAGDAIDDLLPGVDRSAEADAALQTELRKLLRTSLIGLEEEFDRSTSAEQAVISIGNRIHVLTSKLRGRLHEMQGEHGRLPAVARGLMELDQEIGPADCLAASIGVLGGSDRPGRQWQEPQRLLSVVRGGIGRIKDFHRVRLSRLPELGVDGGLVDHLTLIFAHLLDNAARYSPPSEPVVVSGREVPNGVGIEIQDSGKGLSEEKKRAAEHALAGTAPGAGIGGITEDANIGLRVVGVLARRYGIRVTFADSPWLGTSVVVVVPHKYFSPLPATAVTETPAAEPGPEPPAAGAGPAPDGSAESADTTPGGLPRRRSGRTGADAPRPLAPAGPVTGADAASVPPDASFAGLAAFATAGRAGDPEPRTPGDRDTPTGRESTEHRTEESDQTT